VEITLQSFDPEGTTLTYKLVRQPVNGSLNGDGDHWQYLPNPEFNGTDSFTYTVSDGALESGQATVSIRVNSVADAPIAQSQSLKVIQGASMAVVLAGYDGDQDPLIYKVVTQPSQGVLTGTPPNLSYQANDNAAGSDRFTYRVNDGLMDSGLATVRISIGEKSTMGVKTFDGSAITFEVRGANGALLEIESGSSLGIWTPTAIQVLGRGRDIPVPVNFPIDPAVPERFWRLKVLSTP